MPYMKRILIFGMTENPGGVESFLINYYRHINRDEIQFDFLCNTLNEVAYEEELKQLGARTYHIVSRRQNRPKYKKQLTALFKEHAKEWDAIWVNVCSLANIDYLKIAKKYDIRRRIIHSHNAANMEGTIRRTLHELNKWTLHKYATDYWACSDEAADWFYKKSIRELTVVIPNAIDISQYKYDLAQRERTRNELSLTNRFVIGNIGRLHFQKNQSFLIDLFAEYRKRREDAFLFLVGGGEDEEKLRNKVEEAGLTDTVCFAGIRNDIPDLLNTFDFFLFPSLFEGLPIAALEAQANGLPVLMSEGCSQAAVLNNNVEMLSLSAGIECWCNHIDMLQQKGREPISIVEEHFRKHRLDLNEEVIRLECLLTNEQTIISDS